MFSMMPSTGTSVLRNMLRPLRASISARSCGVETMMAPDSGTCCAIVSCTSPVPGGMSITSTSRSSHSTSRSICVSAETTIGPRQMIGVPSSTMKPIDMTLRPKPSIGRSRFEPSTTCGRPGEPEQAWLRRAVDVGIEDAGLEADRLEAEREIDGGRRFADAALARGDCNQVLDARHARHLARGGCLRGRSCRSGRGSVGMRGRAAAAASGTCLLDAAALWGARRRRTAAARRFRCQHRRDALHAGNVLHDLFRCLAQRFEFSRLVRMDGDREIDLVVAEQDFGDKTEINDVALEVGTFDPLQLIENLGLGNRHLLSSRGIRAALPPYRGNAQAHRRACNRQRLMLWAICQNAGAESSDPRKSRCPRAFSL